MRTFRLIDLLLLTAMVAAIYALRQVIDPGTVLLLGFLPGAVFAARVAPRSNNPDLFLRMLARVKQGAAGGSASAILMAVLFFLTVEIANLREQPIVLALAIVVVFGLMGAMGGLLWGVFWSLGEEAASRMRRIKPDEPLPIVAESSDAELDAATESGDYPSNR